MSKITFSVAIIAAQKMADVVFKEDINKAEKRVSKLLDARNTFLHLIVECLVELKTTDAVKENFPEALEYIDEDPNDSLKRAFGELKSKIEKLKNEV